MCTLVGGRAGEISVWRVSNPVAIFSGLDGISEHECAGASCTEPGSGVRGATTERVREVREVGNVPLAAPDRPG